MKPRLVKKAKSETPDGPSYNGAFADTYDLFYAEKPYQAEAAFVDQCLQRYGRGPTKTVLELACGTGNHSFPLEKLGYRISASDFSPDMLKAAQAKAKQRGSAIDFQLADMRELPTAPKPFDAVLCLFNSLGYVLRNRELARTLDGIARNLRPDGLFVFEFWHAPTLIKHYEPLRLRRLQTPQAELLRVSETKLLPAESCAEIRYTLYELRDDHSYRSLQETQVNRYFQVQEMALLLEGAGLEPLHWFDGYREETRITDQTWHVLGVARKTAG